jgi:hypothetical protein
MTTYSGYTESPEKIAARWARMQAKHEAIMKQKAEQSATTTQDGVKVAKG